MSAGVACAAGWPCVVRSCLLVAGVGTLAGCYVPLGTATPYSPRTHGKGHVGVRLAGDYPAVDVLETVTTPPDPGDPHGYPKSEVPDFDIDVGYGVADPVDVEAGLAGELSIIVPVPHDVWVGARYAIWSSQRVSVGVAARVGYAGFLASRRDDPRSGSSVSLIHGGVSAAVETLLGANVRALASVSAQPAWIRPHLEDSTDDVSSFLATAYAATLAVTYRNVGPFVSAGIITSDNPRGTGTVLTGGVAKTF